MRTLLATILLALVLAGCTKSGDHETMHKAQTGLQQDASALLDGQVMAIAYSGFREGQHPDRGDGARNPTREQILEDLQILVASGFRLIRLYDAGENSRTTLELIRDNELPMTVLQGMWLQAEFSNHEGCEWLDEPRNSPGTC